MHLGKYKIAGVVVQIESIYPGIHTRCQDYRCPDDTEAEVCVHTTQADIDAEQIKSDREAAMEGRPEVQHYGSYLETLAVYRKMAKIMLMERDILLFHGSAIAVDGRAVLFTAVSGTGKSTHTALWREMLGDRCFMVNDDKPLLRVGENGTEVCGTPWNGKHDLGTNCAVPLKAICILERGETNEISELAPKDALPSLMQQSYRPDNPRTMLQLLKVIDKMAQNVKFYRLRCNMDPEAAKLSYETMLGK